MPGGSSVRRDAMFERLEDRTLLSAAAWDVFGLDPAQDQTWDAIQAAAHPGVSQAQLRLTDFTHLGELVRYAVSERVSDVSPLAEYTGSTAQGLYDDGVRAAWWQGRSIYMRDSQWVLSLSGLSGSAEEQLDGVRSLLNRTADGLGDELTLSWLGQDGLYLAGAPRTIGFAALSSRLAGVPGYEYIEPDMVIGRSAAEAQPTLTPDDPSYSSQWALPMINAPGAWDVTTGSDEIVVAVLDTGAQINHPDLADNIWVNPFEIAGNGIDDEGNGFIDDVYGWDFGGGDNTSSSDRHGTHVAGIIGAVGDNGLGVSGLNWNVKILNLDIFPSDYTSSSYYIAAMSYLVDLKQRGVNVVASNNSYGSLSGTSSSVINAINRQGEYNILFVAAAGNDGQDVTTTGFNPATNGTPNSIAVASSASNDSRSSFSNWSATRVHIAAPGSSIYATVPTNSYANLSGTSMASPYVAALAGLAYSVAPDASYHQIRQAIFDGGDPVNWSSTPTLTNKRINAQNTVDIARTHVSGTVWLDADADGVFDDLESTITGWTVYADANANQTFDSGEAYAIVQRTGRYDLLLPAGNHDIRIIPSAGYTATLGGGGYSFSLANLQTLEGYDFGFRLNGAQAAGAVFGDANADGIQNLGDPGLADIPVYVDLNQNAARDTDIARVHPSSSPVTITSHSSQTRTVSSGISLSGVGGKALDINVRVDLTHPDVSKLALSLISPTGLTFALTRSATLTGANFTQTLFDDEAATAITGGSAPFTGSFVPASPLAALDGAALDGTWTLQVVNQPGGGTGVINGWSLEAVTDLDEPLTLSNADGSFGFTGLAPGDYQIRPLLPDGWTQIAPVADAPRIVTLAANQTVTGLDFAVQGPGGIIPGKLRGAVYNDFNADGDADPGEPALPGFTVYLDDNLSNTLDPGEAYVLTDAQGRYAFDDLPAGIYHVRLNTPINWNLSGPSATLHSVNLAAGQIADDLDFGAYQRIVRGRVWEDLNANAARDASDPALSGWTVYADLDASGSLTAGDVSDLTDASGVYELLGLPRASVNVRVVLPSNWYPSTPAAGAHLDLDLAATPIIENRDFGNFRKAAINGTVFEDLNYNLVPDTGETRLPNVTVYLDTNNNGSLNTGEPSTLTTATGTYGFTGLVPGSYVVRTVVPGGYVSASPINNRTALTLTSNQTSNNNSFTLVQPDNFRPADLPALPTNGLAVRYYEFGSSLPGSTVNSLDALTPLSTSTDTSFRITTTTADYFGYIWNGYFRAPTDGVYVFYTTSDDGSTLSIGSTLVVNNDGSHGSQERSGRLGLKAGLHPITVKYFENAGGQSMSVSYESATITKAVVPSSALFLATAPSLAPTGLTATPGSLADPRVALQWSYTGVGATAFEIDRSTSSDFAQSLATFTLADPALRSYDDATVDVGVTYHYRVRPVNPIDDGANSEPVSSVILPAAPAVTGVTVNDGSAQRSMVASLTVVFASDVTADDGAFALTRRSDNAVVVPLIANPSGDLRTYILTFSGAEIIAGSLADGVYDLQVDPASVRDAYDQPLSGPTALLTTHRLFGDSDGDKDVDNLDLARFRQSQGKIDGDPAYRWDFDFENDGDVDNLDLARFRQRQGTIITY